MKASPPSQPPQAPGDSTADATAPALHRSGAVARMLDMPVATLRVWERRYALTRPALSPSGQRLYSADDVRRLALLKQLTDRGHAIGRLAPLAMAQLQQVASTHVQALAATQRREQPGTGGLPPMRPWRLAVIGAALGARLQRPALLRRLGRPLALLGPFDNGAQAAAALQASDVDALLVYAPQLHAGWLADLEAAAPALAGVPKAVLYGFAAGAECEALATAGTSLLREPQPDAVVAQWLHTLSIVSPATRGEADGAKRSAPPSAPRRWSDEVLTDFAGRSSTMACECPRHVAELLMQLSHFEAYSAECEHRSDADARIHGYLQQVAAESRAHFEAALEHVALYEGLMLPSSPASSPAPGDQAVPVQARQAKAAASLARRGRP